MPWLAWRWTVCPAPFLPQLVPARQQHCRGRPLATSYQGHAGSWAASGHGKRYSCRHIYSFIVYLRFFPSLPSFTKGERDKKTIYQLFHFVCVCFATHKYASECKRCIVCRGVYLMLGSGMVCSMYPQPPAWRPSLPCLAQWAATAVVVWPARSGGSNSRQQHQQQCFVVAAAVLAAVTSVWGVGPSVSLLLIASLSRCSSCSTHIEWQGY